MGRPAKPENANRKAYQYVMPQATYRNLEYIKDRTGLPINTIINGFVSKAAKEEALRLYEAEKNNSNVQMSQAL